MADFMFQPGLKSYTATISGEKRTYSIEVPQNFDPKTGMAMFFFKGKGGASAAKLTKMFSGALKKYNCIGIYPNAVKRGKEPAEWAVIGTDYDKDYAFYQQIVAQLPDDFPVVLSGVSNGGCFALKLTVLGVGIATCTFAASLWKGLDVEYPSNVYAIHGKKDTSVPYYGGFAHNLTFLPAEESIQLFVPDERRTISKNPMPGGATLTVYKFHNTSQLLSVDKSGHDVMTSYRGINLIDSMMEYFREFV